MSTDGIRTWVDMWMLRLSNVPELLGNLGQNMHSRSGVMHNTAYESSLAGQTALVTGANAGIGLDLSAALARRGAHVVMACRSKERGEAAVATVRRHLQLRGRVKREQLQATQPAARSTADVSSGHTTAQSACETHCSDDKSAAVEPSVSTPSQSTERTSSQSKGMGTGTVEFKQLDLSSLASVRNFGERWKREGPPPHLLFCNAGIMAPPKRGETVDGLESQFQVNYLSHWLLVRTLTEPLPQDCKAPSWQNPFSRRGAAQSHEREQGTRVVLLSSCMHRGGRLDFFDLQARRRYDALQNYADSKLAMVMAAQELQDRFARRGSCSTAVAVDPGVPGVLHPITDGLLTWLLLPPAAATDTLLWAATAPARQAIACPLCPSPAPAPVRCHPPPGAPRVHVAPLLQRSHWPNRSTVAGRFVKRGRVATPSPRAADRSKSAMLWAESCRLTGIPNEQA